LSQSYHGIAKETFEYQIISMDLIFAPFPLYGETIAGLLTYRQDHWTRQMSPSPIFNGSIADGAANMQAAAALMSGTDKARCLNHVGKGWFEVLMATCASFRNDIQTLAQVYVAVTGSSSVSADLQAFQWLHRLTSISLSLFNETRWEGHVLTLKNAVELEESLPSLKPFVSTLAIVNEPVDFLDPSYFLRLRLYIKYLDMANSVSKLFQQQAFPTGHLAIAANLWLLKQYDGVDAAAVPPFEIDFARILATGRTVLVEPLLSSATVFLQASVFHPVLCGELQDLVESDVWSAVIASTKSNIAATVGDKDGFGTKMACRAFDGYLELCHQLANSPDCGAFDENAFFSKGIYRGVQPLSWWRETTKEPATQWTAQLSSVAAMMLSLPAGESHDEFVFSDTGRTFVKGRDRMSPDRLEQLTMITMFIRNFGWSPHKLSEWVTAMLKAQPSLRKGSGTGNK
jgi:hypothetical protein